MLASNPLTCAPVGINPLQGRNILLERMNVEHVDFVYATYQNDKFMNLYRLTQDRSMSREQLSQYLAAEQQELPQNLKRIEWVIFRLKREKKIPIGLAALADYHIAHQRAEILLGIVDTSAHQGYASLEAALLVLDFAFNQIFLHKVSSYVYGYNQYAQKNTEHLGFALEGVLREHLLTQDGFIDLYQNGLLKHDFSNHILLARLSRYLLGHDITNPTKMKISRLDDTMRKKLQNELQLAHSTLDTQ